MRDPIRERLWPDFGRMQLFLPALYYVATVVIRLVHGAGWSALDPGPYTFSLVTWSVFSWMTAAVIWRATRNQRA